MWSQVYLDYAFHRNFNVGFTSHKNDVHIQLSQWQYWWWFWFAAVWALYFLVILRVYNSKIESFNISLNTSLRSHGKWGDFLVALIPLSWCGNILINSNFILRMLEWQNESSLFVVRIQGKQWYWAYKYNSDTNYRLNNIFINVGNNNWLKLRTVSYKLFNSYAGVNSFIYDYEFKQIHKNKLESSNLFKNASRYNSSNYNYDNYQSNKNLNVSNVKSKIYKNLYKGYSFSNTKVPSLNLYKIPSTKLTLDLWYKYYTKKVYVPSYISDIHKVKTLGSKNLNYKVEFTKLKLISYGKSAKASKPSFNLFNYKVNRLSSHYEEDKLDNTFSSAENFREKNAKFPVKLTKGVLNKFNIDLLTNNSELKSLYLFKAQINNSDITTKLSHVEQVWGFRQKRYRKLRPHTFAQNTKYSNRDYTPIENYTKKQSFNKYNIYNSFKNNKYKNELIPVTLARRLLRTKRTLILPVHINITLITNSYDVVHSWFVPGLGLKIDCVPGRSTHHSLYIDSVGFYYGQCAEICGRYHHHMPIRVCALPFEHFLLWWQTKGLPRMYRSEAFLKNKSVLLQKFYN